MKKVLVAVLAVAFLFAGSNLVVAQTALSDSDIQIWGNASILGAAGTVFPDTVGKTRADFNTTDYRVDLYLGKTFSNDGKLVLRLRGGDAGTFNLGAFRGKMNDANNGDNFDVKELWYSQPLFDGLASIQFGKFGTLDSSNKLGGVSAFFNNDATIATPASNLGNNPFTIKVAVNPIDLLTVTYAYSSNANNNKNSGGANQFTTNGYNAVEVNVKPIENGNYRIAYWTNNTQNFVYKDGVVEDGDKNGIGDKKEGASGLWLSLDQKVIDPLTLFARFGLRLDKTRTRDNYTGSTLTTDKDGNPATKTGDIDFGTAGQVWQFGGLVSGSLWSRDKDSVFFAVGQVTNVKDTAIAVGKDPSKDYKGFEFTETHIELNYNFALSEAVTITPFAQYVIGAGKVDTIVLDWTGYAYGIKTGYKF